MSKITGITTQIATLPASNPIFAPGGGGLRFVDNVIVHVDTDDGIRGSSYVWLASARVATTPEPASATFLVQATVKSVAPLAVGEDIFYYERIWARLGAPSAQLGEGLVSIARSGIDMAIWDALCKTVGQPLYRLLGGYREEVQLYSNELVELWNASPDELAERATEIVSQGFRALKMRIGMFPAEPELDDIERVRAVRDAVGWATKLMVDPGGAWSFDLALRQGRRLEELGLAWIEDPLPFHEADQLARLCAELDTPIATGELGFNHRFFLELVEKRSIDMLIFEPMRVGGVTGAIKLAGMTAAHGIPIAAHVYGDLAAHLMAAFPHGVAVEYLPWWSELYADPLKPVAGMARPSQAPGIGMNFDPAALERYATFARLDE